MTKTYRLDLISLAVSVALHSLLFLTPGFTKVFHVKTYRIVDVMPLSFDVNVKSKLIGARAKRGDSQTSMASGSSTDMPRGEISRGGASSHKKLSAMRKGKYKSSVSSGVGYSADSTKVTSLKNGKGKITVSFSTDNFKNQYNGKLPAISYSKLTTYLQKIKKRIVSNWEIPYVHSRGTFPKNKKVVVYISINREGKIDELKVDKLSYDMLFNRSVISAIYASKPFAPIPEDVKLSKVWLKVEFEFK